VPIAHAEKIDIRKGEVYRCLVGKWLYRVDDIVHAGGCRWVFYTVKGGPDCGRQGKVQIDEFCTRVRP
jgi:hypothetical protein